jgi:hypothetical protein
MKNKKPIGWPEYMEPKRINGVVRYYWNAPTWARKRDCPIKSEALGTDYAQAKARCDDVINPIFDSWRTGGASDDQITSRRVVTGTFDWLAGVYKKSPKYTRKPERTRKSYDGALRLVAEYILTNGHRFGSLALKSIQPGTADRLYEKLKYGKEGKLRLRTAGLSMTVSKRAWDVARRDYPSIIPALNPFADMDIGYKARVTRAATLTELRTFVAATDADGSSSLGTGAMIAYYWLQREEDIFMRFAWSDYRPPDNPDRVMIWHHKNHDERIPVPLFDIDGTALWPEMTTRMESVRRAGTLIVMRDRPDPKKKVHLPWMTGGKNPMRYVQSEVRRICRGAGIPDDITFTSFRHGGHTEGADAGLTDAQMRALGGHKTTAALLRYAKETDAQRQVGGRKRLNARTKTGDLSE